MTACSFNIIITVYLSFIILSSHAFEVIQPQSRIVNPDMTASISCEHTANVTSVEDVRLNNRSPSTDQRTLLCQKGQKDCKNITLHQVNPKKWLFIMLNIRPEDMNMKYECEFTVKEDDLDNTKTGEPTILLPGQMEADCTPQSFQLSWILISLLALMFLYSCFITSIYIILTCSTRDPENSIYVEMGKCPSPRSPPVDIYCG